MHPMVINCYPESFILWVEVRFMVLFDIQCIHNPAIFRITIYRMSKFTLVTWHYLQILSLRAINQLIKPKMWFLTCIETFVCRSQCCKAFSGFSTDSEWAGNIRKKIVYDWPTKYFTCQVPDIWTFLEKTCNFHICCWFYFEIIIYD